MKKYKRYIQIIWRYLLIYISFTWKLKKSCRCKDLDIFPLTLKWPKYFYSLGAQGGSMEPPRRLLYHRNFAMKFAPYMYALSKTIIPEKRIKWMLYRFKMAAKWPIFILRHFDFGQNLKNHFPKEFFKEIWLKVGEHE